MNIDNLLVVIEQEAFHDQDVRVLVGVAHGSCGCEINTMGTGKLHRVLDPAFYRVGHCLHVQSRDHCGAKTQKQQKLCHLEKTPEKCKNILKKMLLNISLRYTGDHQ